VRPRAWRPAQWPHDSRPSRGSSPTFRPAVTSMRPGATRAPSRRERVRPAQGVPLTRRTWRLPRVLAPTGISRRCTSCRNYEQQPLLTTCFAASRARRLCPARRDDPTGRQAMRTPQGVPLNGVAGLAGGAILSRRRRVHTAAVMLCRKLPFRGAGHRSCPVLQTGRGGGRRVWP
jgi:hypothetical protein